MPRERWRDSLRRDALLRDLPPFLMMTGGAVLGFTSGTFNAWFSELVPPGRGGDTVAFAAILLYFAALVSLMLGGAILGSRRDERAFVRRCIAARLCGACAYPIGGLPPQRDGLVVCPECGAAWRLPPETTPRA